MFYYSYAVNVAFYVKMKQIGMRTSDHTVLKRIKSLNLLIKEMDDLRIRSGLECDKVIEMFNKGENIPLQKVESVPQEPEPTNRLALKITIFLDLFPSVYICFVSILIF